jgi:RHS repeat-associated protein
VTGEMVKIRENGATSGVGVLATYTYDQLGRRSSLTYGNGESASYSYDAVSRLSQLSHDLGGSATTNDLTLTFAYNPASQIVSTTRSNNLYAWTGHGSGTTSTTADGLNRIASWNATLTYDAKGNLTSDGIKTFAYDSENRQASVNGYPFHYDPLGRLDGAGSPLAIAYENYVDNLVAERTPGSSTVQRRHVFGPGTDEPLVWYEGSDRRFLHADERGSIVSVTSSSGALLSINRYDEYGRTETTNTGNYLSRFGYTGQRYFGGFGLYHYKNRMYDPRAGRFMQPDPIGYDGGMNLYPYVGGDPVNFIDPLGLDEGPIVVHGCQEGRVYDAHEDRCVPDNRHLLPRNPTFDPAEMGFAMLGWATCVIGLVQANKDVDALQRADDNMGAVNAAAANNGIDPRLLAAIGVRESGFQSVVQSGGRGVGVFQIDLGKNPLVTRAQALDVDWAADFAANMLHDNMVVLASRYDPLHLLQATAASYNLGRRIRNLTGNPKTIDNGTPGGDYGASVVNMMACF